MTTDARPHTAELGVREDHEQLDHRGTAMHHHHSHTAESVHEAGHHLLSVEDLSVAFRLYDPDYSGFLRAPKMDVPVLSNLSISVHAGEVLALVGGSGSGKSVLADAIIGVYEPNAQVSGRIWFDGVRQDAASLARLRRGDIAYMPQSLQSLDPLSPVGCYFAELTPELTRQERQSRVDRWLDEFELEPTVVHRYPHELSGGMARRVIAVGALVRKPRLVVADEPTPGLDERLAAKVLAALKSRTDQGGGVLLITHDLSLALDYADRVAVFYDGTVVEETSVAAFASPETLRSEFARALWHALPEHDFDPTGVACG